MLVVEIVLAAVVVFGVAAVAMGYGGSITHFAPDWPGHGLPEGRTLRADDIAAARFSLAVRGYRMSEVDAALDRLAQEIAERDERIVQLTGRAYEAPERTAQSDRTAPPSDDEPKGPDAGPPAAEPSADTAPLPPVEGLPPIERPPFGEQGIDEGGNYQLPDSEALADNPFAPPRLASPRVAAPNPADFDTGV